MRPGRAGRNLIAVLLTAMTTVAACGSSAGTPIAPETVASGLTGEFATIDGSTIDLNDLRGQDVVLWFWAPW